MSGRIFDCQCLANADADHSHEHVASLMATPARPFLNTYNDAITELKCNFMSYVKALRASDPASRSATETRLQMTNEGFPILPTPWKGSEYKKKELEQWFMLYVGQHYSMMTSYSTNHYLSACRTSQQWSWSRSPIQSNCRSDLIIHQS